MTIISYMHRKKLHFLKRSQIERINNYIMGRLSAKKGLRACAKCVDSHHPAHMQSVIRAFALHSYILLYPMIRRPRWLIWMRIRLKIRRVRSPPGRQHSFEEIDHEILSTVILSITLIQEGQLSVSGERMCTILVNRLED